MVIFIIYVADVSIPCRDQKAQLLLVNIAVASDILEVYELMKEDLVKTDFHKIIIVLSVWTLSLFQVNRSDDIFHT